MNAAERQAAIAELDREGLSSREIADRLGCTQRTVHRARAKRRADGDTWTWSPPEPDEMAVERAASGDQPPGLTWIERHAAIALCDKRGVPARITAARLKCTRQTVYYARSKRAAA